jgi:hypothetical protein
MGPSTLEERRAALRRWAREEARAVRKSLAAFMRVLGPA